MSKPFDYFNDGTIWGINRAVEIYKHKYPDSKPAFVTLSQEELEVITEVMINCFLRYPNGDEYVGPNNIKQLNEKYSGYSVEEIKLYAKFRTMMANIFLISIGKARGSNHLCITLQEVLFGINILSSFNVPKEEFENIRGNIIIKLKMRNRNIESKGQK